VYGIGGLGHLTVQYAKIAGATVAAVDVIDAKPEMAKRLPIFETVLRGIKVAGSLAGTRADLAETFELHAGGRTHIVRESRQLDDVKDPIREVEKGEGEARLVFDLRS
jgi:D-arabinose 1-dehydrogenase-like Zn-dependent alcohol dehydrogenase